MTFEITSVKRSFTQCQCSVAVGVAECPHSGQIAALLPDHRLVGEVVTAVAEGVETERSPPPPLKTSSSRGMARKPSQVVDFLTVLKSTFRAFHLIALLLLLPGV